MTSEREEYAKLAVKFAREHWDIQEGGALWTGFVVHFAFADNCFVQFKPVTPQYEAYPLSDADKFNGIEARCAVHFCATAFRIKRRPGPYEDWKNWRYGKFWSVKLEKRNGVWSTTEQLITLARGKDGEIDWRVQTIESKKPKPGVE